MDLFNLLSAAGGAVAMAIVWFFRHWTESRQREREAFQEDRRRVYMSILDPMISFDVSHLSAKARRKKWEIEFRKAVVELKLMAPDSVVAAVDELFLGYSEDHGDLAATEQADRMNKLLGGLLLEIRKDLGNPATSLTERGMMRTIVKDIDRYLPLHEQ